MMGIWLVGNSHAINLRAPLAAALGQPVQLDAVVGTSTPYWIGKPHSGDLIIVELGTNDIYSGVSPGQSGVNADAIERAQDGPVLWIGPPAYSRDAGTADAIAGYVSNFFDSRGAPGTDQRQSDGVHLTTAGYTAWARAIAARILAQSPAAATTDAQAAATNANGSDNNGLLSGASGLAVIGLAGAALLLLILWGD